MGHLGVEFILFYEMKLNESWEFRFLQPGSTFTFLAIEYADAEGQSSLASLVSLAG